jgi:hypothetical protein
MRVAAVRTVLVVVSVVLFLSGCTGTIESPLWGPSNEGSGDRSPDQFGDDSDPEGRPTGPSSIGTTRPQQPGGRDPSVDPTGDPGALQPGGGNDPSAEEAALVEQCAAQRAVGTSPLRRLTRSEYDNSVADLLGDTTQPARGFVADTQVGLFDNTASTQTVPTLLAEQYLDSAVRLAEGVSDITKLVGCNPTSGATCVRGFITRFGRRAYRRPLTSEETTRFVTMYDNTVAISDAATGVRSVVAALLASPNFLFRPEFGNADASELPGAKTLTGFEIAARLSNLIWASAPDDILLDAAQNGQLGTRSQVADQARRMMDDPRARPALAEFYKQWFGLGRIESASKDTAVYPEFDDALRTSMAEESRRFIEDVLWNGDAKLETLLTASYSFVNGPLAELYGVAGPADDDSFERVELDPEQRAGVLTQASVLTSYARPDQSSPVKRGQWVRVRMLCQDLPDPPANIPELPQPKEGVSNRERFAMHTSNPACAGCHNLIDGLGFGLEAYDGVGRFRTVDEGVAVNSMGEVTATTDINGKYDGAVELATRLAGSAQVRDCAPTQWLHYALGRREETSDACSALELKKAFATSGGDLRELMVALTQTDAFWHYRQEL